MHKCIFSQHTYFAELETGLESGIKIWRRLRGEMTHKAIAEMSGRCGHVAYTGVKPTIV